nr:protein kinase-like domain, concanavalin A-like lectin/glucanase domain protein [Tanacetum cinerariifolium]
MGDANPIRILGDYSRPSHEGYRNTIELPEGNNVVHLRSDTIRGPHDTQYCMENPKQAFVDYASSCTDEAGGLVSNFMASQDARLSKFEADFKQQQSETTNKIDTVLKAITDRMEGALPIDTVKNPKLNVNSISPVLNDEEKEVEWIDAEKPLDLIDIREESVYESLIKDMPRCSLNYDFRIRKGNPKNLKIPCMIGHKFMANAYIDVDLPMNIVSLAYYNSIRKDGYEYRGINFVGLGRDMHVFEGNMSYVMDFAILENIETNIDPSLSHVVFGRPFVEIICLAINRKHGLMTFMDGIREVTFKTLYKDPERNELTSKGHDLLSSRVILSEDDYDGGYRRPSDL